MSEARADPIDFAFVLYPISTEDMFRKVKYDSGVTPPKNTS